MSTIQNIPWLFVITCCLYYKLPEGFQKCNRRQADFSECLRKAVENALRQLNKPIKEYGLYLEPLEIPPFSIAAREKWATYYHEYKSHRMFGFSVVNCSKVEMDFITNNLAIDCTFPEITTLIEYHLDGKLFDSTFNGTGAGSYMIKNLRINLSFILGEYEKFGQVYYAVVGHKFEMDPELIENIHLGNIVRGDPIQSRKINEAFNKNWKISKKMLFEDIKSDYERPIGDHIVTIFNNLLEKVPISEIFDDY